MTNKIKRELDKGEITLQYNDNTGNQTHLTRTMKTEGKTIKSEDEPLPKPSQLETKILNNKNVKSNNKLLHKTSRIRAMVPDNKDIKILIQPENTKASTQTPVSCTNIVSSDVTKVILKRPALETIQTKKTKVTVNSVNSLNEIKPSKSTFKAFTSSSNEQLKDSSYTKPVHPLPFNGARFLQTQVHSNSVLQTLLKDIISLSNEKDEVDENVISQEVARLRAKNNLPSLNAEVPVNLEFEDSDFSEGSEDETSCYYNPKISENYGKDSGYDNESQYSESLEDDNISETQDNSRNAAEKSLVLTQPEYIDLDKYFGSKKRKLVSKSSLVHIRTISRSSQLKDDSINDLNKSNELTCPICNKTLMSKRSYKKHTKDGTGCIKNAGELKLIHCKGKCKFFGTNEEFFIHRQEKHSSIIKNNLKDRTVVPVTCEKCSMSFIGKTSLNMHYKTHHKQQMTCLFCDFVCENLTTYNLHISSKHSKRVKNDSTSSDSDGLQIVEVDDED